MNRKVVIGIAILIFCVYVFLMVVVTADKRDVYTAYPKNISDTSTLNDTLPDKK